MHCPLKYALFCLPFCMLVCAYFLHPACYLLFSGMSLLVFFKKKKYILAIVQGMINFSDIWTKKKDVLALMSCKMHSNENGICICDWCSCLRSKSNTMSFHMHKRQIALRKLNFQTEEYSFKINAEQLKPARTFFFYDPKNDLKSNIDQV